MRLDIKVENFDIKDKFRYKSRFRDQYCFRIKIFLGKSKLVDGREEIYGLMVRINLLIVVRR